MAYLTEEICNNRTILVSAVHQGRFRFLQCLYKHSVDNDDYLEAPFSWVSNKMVY